MTEGGKETEPAAAKRPTVLLADDHRMVAEGLGTLLRDQFDLVGSVDNGRTLLEAARQHRPDVIVTDISMPLLNGLDAVRQLRKQGNEAKIIFLTMHLEPYLAVEAFRAGASGYLLKQSAGEELVAAIREVLQGRVYLTPLIARDLIGVLMEARDDPREGVERLTPRQREVLQLVAEGKTMKEIARLLNISTRTAESHKYEMMQALGIETTAELIQFGIKIGIISVDTL